MLAAPEEVVTYAADVDRSDKGLIFKRTKYYSDQSSEERVISAATGSLADVSRNGATHYVFSLEKTGDTTPIDSANYIQYHVTITVNGTKYYMTSRPGLTTYSSQAATFLIKYASASGGQRLCLFYIAYNDRNQPYGKAVEFEDNGSGLTLCAQNDPGKNGWNICNDAYNLETANVLVNLEYNVTITKAYAGVENNETAEGLKIILTKDGKSYEFTKNSEGKYTCNEHLAKGTYTITESGTEIDGYQWLRKDKETVEIPYSAPSTQSLIGGAISIIDDFFGGGGGYHPGGGNQGGGSGSGSSSGSGSTTTKTEVIDTAFTVTNTYTEKEDPKATSATKEVVLKSADGTYSPALPTGYTPDNSITFPANKTDALLITGNSVTLLYKITVTGEAGASFSIAETAGTELVYPSSVTKTDSTYSGTIPTGETSFVFYVKKTFNDLGNQGTLTNSITLEGKDPSSSEDVPYTKKALVTITKEFTGNLPTEQQPAIKIKLKYTDSENTVQYIELTKGQDLTYTGRVPAGTYTVVETNSNDEAPDVQHYTRTTTLATPDSGTDFDITVANGQTYTYTLTNNYTKLTASSVEKKVICEGELPSTFTKPDGVYLPIRNSDNSIETIMRSPSRARLAHRSA